MGLFTETEVTWKGETKKFTADMAFLDSLESGEPIVAIVLNGIDEGRPRNAAGARLIGRFLREVGFDATDEEALQVIQHDSAAAMGVLATVIASITTEPMGVTSAKKDKGGS